MKSDNFKALQKGVKAIALYLIALSCPALLAGFRCKTLTARYFFTESFFGEL
jgi:hypothetical protein